MTLLALKRSGEEEKAVWEWSPGGHFDHEQDSSVHEWVRWDLGAGWESHMSLHEQVNMYSESCVCMQTVMASAHLFLLLTVSSQKALEVALSVAMTLWQLEDWPCCGAGSGG